MVALFYKLWGGAVDQNNLSNIISLIESYHGIVQQICSNLATTAGE